jgi:hypothetical protein
VPSFSQNFYGLFILVFYYFCGLIFKIPKNWMT